MTVAKSKPWSQSGWQILAFPLGFLVIGAIVLTRQHGPTLPTAIQAKVFMLEDMNAVVSLLELRVAKRDDPPAKGGYALLSVTVNASDWPPLGGQRVVEAFGKRGWEIRGERLLCKKDAELLVRPASSTEDGLILMSMSPSSIKNCKAAGK